MADLWNMIVEMFGIDHLIQLINWIKTLIA